MLQMSMFSSPTTQAAQPPRQLPGCSLIYQPAGRAREYAALACNVYSGCDHGCAYCLTGDTLVYLADLRAIPISELKPGDILLGVSQEGAFFTNSHKYVPSVVEHIWTTRKPVYEVELENGSTVRCSGDHRWLTDRGWKYTTGSMCTSPNQRPYLTTNNKVRITGKPIPTPAPTDEYRRGYLSGIIRGDGHLAIHGPRSRVYVRKDRGNRLCARTDTQYMFLLRLQDKEPLLRARDYLLHFGLATNGFRFTKTMDGIRSASARTFYAISEVIEWSESPEYLRGFLAGIYDAEGSHSRHTIRISNNDPEILKYIELALAAHGFAYVYDVPHAAPSAPVQNIRIKGGASEHVRFWQLTDPAITRKRTLVGGSLKAQSRVVRITDLGYEDTMYDIQTTSETFFANGLVSHNCYAPSATRRTPAEFYQASERAGDFLRKLEREADKYQAAGIRGRVLLSFTCDPYQHLDVEAQVTRRAIQILHRAGLNVEVLTKGGTRALRDLDLFGPGDAFATTMTLLDPARSREWEPEAAGPNDRIEAIGAFHEAGVPTWVSLEPVLDPAVSLDIIRRVRPTVDVFKVGTLNYSERLPAHLRPQVQGIDWGAFGRAAVQLLNSFGYIQNADPDTLQAGQFYVKQDLARHL
jgi:DNA repair photolyase